MAENFSNLGRCLNIQVHETNRSPKNFNPNNLLQDIIKWPKTKDKKRILKVTREKYFHIQNGPISLSVDFSAETWKEQNDDIRILSAERKNRQPRIFYPTKLS